MHNLIKATDDQLEMQQLLQYSPRQLWKSGVNVSG